MACRRNPQTSFDFAQRSRKTGGLDPDHYRAMLARLKADAQRLAAQFRLPPFTLEADRPDARSRYGQCDSDGHIVVRLVNVRTGQVLKYSALVDTVVHELAHLRHLNHGPRWEALYHRMLEWARREGIYEPRPVGFGQDAGATGSPEEQAGQLGLFGPARHRRPPPRSPGR